MFPFKTSIQFDRKCNQALYLQLSNQIIQLIKDQTLAPNTKLPGSRTLAEQLNVHRKIIVACYEELLQQGWIESIPKKGTFVLRNLPLLDQEKLENSVTFDMKKNTGFTFYKTSVLRERIPKKKNDFMYLNDGVSDGRLTPINEIARTYRRISAKKNVFEHLSYGSTYGNDTLRDVLVDYLNTTRGLHITKENVLITRGSQMGNWLSSQLLLRKNDIVVVGNTNYDSADSTFLNQQAKLERVLVDDNGLVTDEIEKLCKRQQIEAVYVTSHHHHPTTVTLSAKRRIHLLNLAKQYNFAIIEDDYDYDFNYNHAPILPLASHDTNGNVVYIGSICKTVAPVFRIGYLIASKEFVDESSKLRGIVDRQGDALLELTFADFIKSGDLDRHIRKVMKIYKQRRDLFCKLLKDELNDVFQFEIPKGGLAVWAKLNSNYSWKTLSEVAKIYKLDIGEWQRYDNAKLKHNCIRIGFASNNEEEIYELINRLKKTMGEVVRKNTLNSVS
ncbi:PLP-dependent aminotransferase family protein [Winogradskyella sp. PG-2]|uniref:MocR-like pyridoxine biosynthesis transcription factor PdxR n=1 Tax=Winogradskyella sp. PG-2 TaxID=754409 RepID=UPI0004588B54|nr:PLP-dependent aminotransferase family protein [Winogradskyella sp. PG-2]BAO76743.1 transcriptional regulator, GntR family domain [Winogradskyella sp. PG-2]